MIPFPHPDPAWLTEQSAQTQRKIWLASLLDISKKWLMEGGDVLVWLEEFQRLRESTLHLGWHAYLPESLRNHLHYIRFGSAGRGEDLHGSDLDYAIVTDCQVNAEQINEHLYDFTRGMGELGFPPCKGHVMGTNPRWIGSIADWRARIDEYFAYPSWENSRYLFMMVDGRPLGSFADWPGLVEIVTDRIRNSPFICWEMAHLGIHRTVSLDLLGNIKLQRAKQSEYISVKDGLLSPIIHSTRLLAVSEGCNKLSTLQRLSWLESRGILSSEFTIDLRAALAFGWRLRVIHQMDNLNDSPVCALEALKWCDLSKAQQEETMVHLQSAKTLERMVHRRFRKPR